MSIYTSRALSSYGAMAAFAGGGRSIFGPFAFSESWSSDDFGSSAHFNQWVKPYLDQVPEAKGMTYDPPSSAIITRAGTAWEAWKAASDLGVAEADTYIATTTSKMKSLIARADELSLTTKGWPFVASREEKIEVQRYQVFAQIVAVIKQVAASLTKVNALSAAAVAAGAVPTPHPEAALPGGVPADTGTGGSGTSRSAMTATPDNMMLYIALGVGAVALVGGGIFLMRRKKAAHIAGYKRRSRRSRR